MSARRVFVAGQGTATVCCISTLIVSGTYSVEDDLSCFRNVWLKRLVVGVDMMDFV